MAGGEDDTSCCLFACYCQFGGRGGGKTDVHYVISHTYERAADDLLCHLSAQPCIAPYYNLVVLRHGCAALRSISGGETNDIYRVETFTYATSYRAAYT